ncbi:MAG: hypothetical protein KAS32_23155 [Candidatus Peribacteraceae bacterium]|nr:hypothetical protein [Candidatus Peribacteraceae bacterium]
MRVKSYDVLIKNELHDIIKTISDIAEVNIYISYKHIVSRMKDRDIDLIQILESLALLRNNHICEFIYLISLNDSIRPFRIEFKSDSVIIVFGYANGDWKFSTILDPKRHSMHRDEKKSNFYARIDL